MGCSPIEKFDDIGLIERPQKPIPIRIQSLIDETCGPVWDVQVDVFVFLARNNQIPTKPPNQLPKAVESLNNTSHSIRLKSYGSDMYQRRGHVPLPAQMFQIACIR